MKPLVLLCLAFARAPHFYAAPPTREAVLADTLAPYTGPSVKGVDASTLTGKTMCGYQGWFACEGDGAERGWVHWTKGKGTLGPGNAKIHLWPDVSEFGADERFPTDFVFPNGKAAEVFSSFKQATVLRHFQWMRDYGIDGAFVQRFITDLRSATAPVFFPIFLPTIFLPPSGFLGRKIGERQDLSRSQSIVAVRPAVPPRWAASYAVAPTFNRAPKALTLKFVIGARVRVVESSAPNV